MWFSTLVKSKCIAPRTLLLLRRCNRRSKLKPCHLQWLKAALICRSYEFLDDSFEDSAHTSVLHLWVIVCQRLSDSGVVLYASRSLAAK